MAFGHLGKALSSRRASPFFVDKALPRVSRLASQPRMHMLFAFAQSAMFGQQVALSLAD